MDQWEIIASLVSPLMIVANLILNLSVKTQIQNLRLEMYRNFVEKSELRQSNYVHYRGRESKPQVKDNENERY